MTHFHIPIWLAKNSYEQWNETEDWLLTLVPLLGPIGGGLGLGASPSTGAVVVAGGAPSSAALTTSLDELLFLKGKDNM